MKLILDACCGTRAFWFNKHNPNVCFVDKRYVERDLLWQSKDGKEKTYYEVKPDIIADFQNLPFDDCSFYHVVFDPPHLVRAGEKSWLAKKYGSLRGDWKTMIFNGFNECMRVLKPKGTLVFKWNEEDVSLSDILNVIKQEPLYGHRSGKAGKTIWLVFMKME